MKPPVSTPPGTAASRLKDRIFQGWSHREEPRDEGQANAKSPTCLPALQPQRQVGFPARIAEFLLVFRLKARRRSTLSADILERALSVVLVTCRNWFGVSDAHPPHPPRPRRHE